MNGVRRGDIWDAELPKVGRRPCVVLTRDEAIPVLARVTVAVITSSVRGHPGEVPLGSEHGLDLDSVANCDDIVTIGKALLSRRRGSLNVSDIVRLDTALCVALGIELA